MNHLRAWIILWLPISLNMCVSGAVSARGPQLGLTSSPRGQLTYALTCLTARRTCDVGSCHCAILAYVGCSPGLCPLPTIVSNLDAPRGMQYSSHRYLAQRRVSRPSTGVAGCICVGSCRVAAVGPPGDSAIFGAFPQGRSLDLFVCDGYKGRTIDLTDRN